MRSAVRKAAVKTASGKKEPAMPETPAQQRKRQGKERPRSGSDGGRSKGRGSNH